MRAAYWVAEPGGDITFRAIVGWVTDTRRNRAAPNEPPQNDFQPIVIDDDHWPVIAIAIPGPIGVFPIAMDADGVKAILAKWQASGKLAAQIAPRGGFAN